jgi:hypothetical protein
MRWFRRNIRLTRSFALFALMMHFALTFGHVHFETFINVADAAAALTGQGAPSGAALPALPAGPSKNAKLRDYCAICASIQLADSLLSAATPPLTVPASFSMARPGRDFQFAPARPDRIAFDARGPPLA